MTRPSLPNPLELVGRRRDGRPIYPILGASPEDDSNKPDDDSGSAVGSVTQEDLSRLLAREKTQGGRAAVKKLLGDLGFDNSEALSEFITTKRDAEQAALTEVERREQAAEEKLRTAEAREAQAAARERAAIRRAALAGLGSAGEDLGDAILLIDRVLDDQPDADEEAVAAAAEQLKERRPELFGQSRETSPAAPGGSPAGGPPSRGGVPPKPGEAGLEMARRRGFVTG
ncbi:MULTISPECIES: hypothetical protein [unclassified Streptomyces]|uniref:hypothetical protein n=1 Tax=unclassified Streptomyces TaxID=2593676 RepID=UPI002E125936|nr:hypothetical protein OG452_24665 [Streptomyces sp. NBC_01197]WSS49055.1 hypothetical protein OG708_10580 [Streptomyces sp. NBC_01180]